MNTTPQGVDLLAKTLAGAICQLVDEAVAKRDLAPTSSEADRMDHLKRKESLTEAEVAELYGYAKTTLRTWRCRGRGPAYVKDGGVILYRQKDVQAYQEQKRVRTADAR